MSEKRRFEVALLRPLKVGKTIANNMRSPLNQATAATPSIAKQIQVEAVERKNMLMT